MIEKGKGDFFMMVSQQDKITVSQTVIIITNFLLGTGILTLPRTSVEAV
jgi:spore germination protein